MYGKCQEKSDVDHYRDLEGEGRASQYIGHNLQQRPPNTRVFISNVGFYKSKSLSGAHNPVIAILKLTSPKLILMCQPEAHWFLKQKIVLFPL